MDFLDTANGSEKMIPAGKVLVKTENGGWTEVQTFTREKVVSPKKRKSLLEANPKPWEE